MKKTNKIIIINVLIFIVLLICAEIISHHTLVNRYRNEIIAFNKIDNNGIQTGLRYSKAYQPDRKTLLSDFRPVNYYKSNKKPIILFGCSYTEGFGLEENETFSKKLSDYTHRTVYNRGKSATGITFLYYQLNDKKVMKKLPKDTEYIIFTLIPDHFPRLFRYRSFVLSGNYILRYKIQGDKLKEEKLKIPIIHSLFTTIVLEEYLCNKNSSDINKVRKLTVKLFEESIKLIKSNFENAKFVILYVKNPNDKMDMYDCLLEDIQKTDKNIKIIDISQKFPELVQDYRYWLVDKYHPSSQYWDEVIPYIQKELNL